MKLDLTDAETEALEALAKKQELSPARVLIQGLRHYQLLVEGEPDLGPMLPPGVPIAPEWPVGDAYVTWYDPQEIPKPGKLIDCSVAVIDRAEIGDHFYSEKQVHEIVALSASPSSLPDPGVAATHRHKRRGTEYVLIGYGKVQASKWKTPTIRPDEDGQLRWTHVSIDMHEVAIYRSVDDGSLWVRPREEFEDGRFEALPAVLKGGQ